MGPSNDLWGAVISLLFLIFSCQSNYLLYSSLFMLILSFSNVLYGMKGVRSLSYQNQTALTETLNCPMLSQTDIELKQLYYMKLIYGSFIATLFQFLLDAYMHKYYVMDCSAGWFPDSFLSKKYILINKRLYFYDAGQTDHIYPANLAHFLRHIRPELQKL
jgi:hypothetical protein